MMINQIQQLKFKAGNAKNQNIVMLPMMKAVFLGIEPEDSFVKLDDNEFDRYQKAIKKRNKIDAASLSIGALSSIPIVAAFSKITNTKLNKKMYAAAVFATAIITTCTGGIIAMIINKAKNTDLNLPYVKYYQDKEN